MLKLNAVRDFQTGIYDYNVMTSVFARVAPGWPLAKVSFSSQEWCGHVYHQLLPRAGSMEGVFHSYFDGEADGTDDLRCREGGVFEDALPILVRGWQGAYLQPGESAPCRSCRACCARASTHEPLAWGRATISARAAPSSGDGAGGRVPGRRPGRWRRRRADHVARTSSRRRPPYRLVRWSSRRRGGGRAAGVDAAAVLEAQRARTGRST